MVINVSSDTFRILKVYDKSQTGPYCTLKDFDLNRLPGKLRDLVKEYDIRYDPDQPVPLDNSLADSLFQAGFQLFLDLGVLCLNTERLIKFEEEEVNTALRNLEPEVRVGSGRDSRNVYYRKVEDSKPPIVFGGPFGGLLSAGRPYVDAMTSMAKEPVVSMICRGSPTEIEGRNPTLGTPIEMHAAKCEARWLREAAARAGRPGMHIVGSVAESAAADIATSDLEFGYRPTDGRNVTLLTSLKTNYNMLCKIKHYLDYSTFIYSYTTNLIGGISGGPATTAVVEIASHLADAMINQATYQAICVMHIHLMNTSSRDCVWTQNLVGQALARNSKIITFLSVGPSAGPSTEMILYEVAANSLGAVGGGNLLGVFGTGGKLHDKYTGLEQRFMGEIGVASTKLKREDANDLTKNILRKYEKHFQNPPLGKDFQDCYDTEKLIPNKEWQQKYEAVKKEIQDLGIPIEN